MLLHDSLNQFFDNRITSNETKLIDESFWTMYGETCAIVFTDLHGFSRRSKDLGIIHFMQIIYESQKIIIPIVQSHNGTIIKSMGDSIVIIFDTVCSAVSCFMEIQNKLIILNKSRNDNTTIELGVGIGFGNIINLDNNDIFGEEVNWASKLGEDLSSSYEILLTESAKNSLSKSIFSFSKLVKPISNLDVAFKLNYT